MKELEIINVFCVKNSFSIVFFCEYILFVILEKMYFFYFCLILYLMKYWEYYLRRVELSGNLYVLYVEEYYLSYIFFEYIC